MQIEINSCKGNLLLFELFCYYSYFMYIFRFWWLLFIERFQRFLPLMRLIHLNVTSLGALSLNHSLKLILIKIHFIKIIIRPVFLQYRLIYLLFLCLSLNLFLFLFFRKAFFYFGVFRGAIIIQLLNSLFYFYLLNFLSFFLFLVDKSHWTDWGHRWGHYILGYKTFTPLLFDWAKTFFISLIYF